MNQVLRKDLERAWAEFRSAHPADALAVVTPWLDRPDAATSPESAPVWAAAAAFAQAMHRQRDATDWAQRALSLDEQNGTAHMVLGETAASTRKWDDAEAHFRRAFAAYPTPRRAAKLCRVLRLAGHAQTALGQAQDWLSQWPNDPFLLDQAAEAAEAANRPEEAQALWQRLAGLPGQAPRARARLLRLRTKEMQPAEAAKELEKVAARRSAQERPSLLAEAARRLDEAGQAQAAADQWAKALAESPGDLSFIRQHAFALRRAGQASQAREALKSLLKRDPSDRYVRAALLADFLREDRQGGEAFFTELMRERPDHPELYGALRRLKAAPGPTPEPGRRPTGLGKGSKGGGRRSST